MLETGQLLVNSQGESVGASEQALVEHSQYFPYELVSRIDDQHFWFRVRNEIILRAIGKYLPNWDRASFLEIGSGAATVLDFLDAGGMTSLEGCDINPLAIRISRSRLPHINFNDCSYEELISRGVRKDAVGMFDFIEHLENDHSALTAALALMKPGARLFITVPAHQSLYSSVDEMMGHYRRYSKESLSRSLLRAGFDLVNVSYVMPTMYPLVALKRRLVNTVVPHSQIERYNALVREVDQPHSLVNALLTGWLRTEHHLLGGLDSPFGGSLLAVAAKPA